MNYKLLFPTYRARQRWVLRTLDRVNLESGAVETARMVNVGCGEGDIDRALRARAGHLISCDVNEGDVAHARALNADVPGLEYMVADAQRLPFDDASFDVVCCLEVIEHVGDPRVCLRELARIVRPSGHIVLTCPSARFPLTYDPVNWVLSRAGRHLSVGAFGYGHSWLVREDELVGWARAAGLVLRDQTHMSKALASAFECYWPGLVQRVVKANAGNRAGGERALPSVRPSTDDPPLLALADAFIDADDRLFAWSQSSVSLGFLFQAQSGDD